MDITSVRLQWNPLKICNFTKFQWNANTLIVQYRSYVEVTDSSFSNEKNEIEWLRPESRWRCLLETDDLTLKLTVTYRRNDRRCDENDESSRMKSTLISHYCKSCWSNRSRHDSVSLIRKSYVSSYLTRYWMISSVCLSSIADRA